MHDKYQSTRVPLYHSWPGQDRGHLTAWLPLHNNPGSLPSPPDPITGDWYLESIWNTFFVLLCNVICIISWPSVSPERASGGAGSRWLTPARTPVELTTSSAWDLHFREIPPPACPCPARQIWDVCVALSEERQMSGCEESDPRVGLLRYYTQLSPLSNV